MVRSQAFRLPGLAAFFSSWMGRLEQSKSWWISLKRGEVILNLSTFLRIMRVRNPYATIVWIRLPWRGCHLLLQGGNTTQPNTCGIHVHRGSTCGDAQGADSISCGGFLVGRGPRQWITASKTSKKPTLNSEVLGLRPCQMWISSDWNSENCPETTHTHTESTEENIIGEK